MNLFGWIINKFKKKDYNIGIIRFGDSIAIPGRDYFKEDCFEQLYLFKP